MNLVSSGGVLVRKPVSLTNFYWVVSSIFIRFLIIAVLCEIYATRIYAFTQTICHLQDMMQAQILNGVNLVWIQSLLIPRLFALPMLNNPIYPTIHP